MRHSSGRIPASNAATRARSISRGRGSGSASAVTMTSWSAFATIDPLDRVVVVGRTPQHGLALGDLDDPGEAAVGARDVADDPDPVADDHALAAQRPRLHRHHGDAVDQQRVAAAVDGDDDAVDGVVVRRALLGARPGAATRPLVVLVVVVA